MTECRSPASTASRQMPPRNVVPKPVQKPHPPLWVACSRRDTILLAAEKGIGALSFAFIDPEEAQHWVADYERTLAEKCVPIGEAVNPNIACVTPMMCAPTEEEAIDRGLEGGNFFGYSLGHYYVFGDHPPARDRRVVRVRRAPRRARATRRRSPPRCETSGSAPRSRPATPRPPRRDRHARADPRLPAALRGGRRRPADLRDAGRQEPPRAHLRGDRALRHEVLPEFKDRDEAHVAAKAKRLAPVIEAAMARKERTRQSCRRTTRSRRSRGASSRRQRTSRARSGSRSSPTAGLGRDETDSLGILG